MFTVIPCVLLFALFGSDFSGSVAPWWCFLEGISYLLYRILDEMDGKQARKTGNSSPLGLLFDHGCDSFTTALFTMMIIKMIQVGNSMYVLLALGAVTQSFYFCTLEEYYIGGLYLGVGNGVTDLSLFLISLFFICGFNSEFFLQTLNFTWKSTNYSILYADIIVYATIIS